MMNGIVGAPSNWDVVQEKFRLHADTRSLALLASTANSRLQVPAQPNSSQVTCMDPGAALSGAAQWQVRPCTRPLKA